MHAQLARTRTRVQVIGDGVEHVRVEVRMNCIVRGRVVLGGDEDGIALSDTDVDLVDGVRFRLDAVSLDDAHLVVIDPEVEARERARVDDPETVRLARLERDRSVLVEACRRRCATGLRTLLRREVLAILRKIHKWSLCIPVVSITQPKH